MARCPCLSGSAYAACCGPLHSGERAALTCEQLMRSRYSAFAVHDLDYLLRTWHPTTRPHELRLDADLFWFRLDVIATAGGSPFETTGTVEFRAHYRAASGSGSQHEISRFVREDRQWFYVDGYSA